MPDQPVRRPVGRLRSREGGLAADVGGGADRGLAAQQAIDEWLEFAAQAGCLRVAGQRTFGSDLERLAVEEEEARCLYAFARSRQLGFPERTLEIAERSPSTKGGAEHRVYFDIRSREGRVVKITVPGKYGRWEHTPFQYLDRWRLLNEMVPVVDVHFEDCIQTNENKFSIVTSMQYFKGPHPSSQEADDFVRSLGFELLTDGSATLDYISEAAGLILRDCHPQNWIKAEGALIPIDIIPEPVRRNG